MPGPAGFHPPSAAQLGVSLPDPGQGLYYGLLETNEDVVIVDTRRYPGRAPLDGTFTLLFDRNGFNVWSRKP